MSNLARPAVGHMPFPGHRTCAEWDRPITTNLPARDKSLASHTEAGQLAWKADVPYELAQLVVMRANQSGITTKRLRHHCREQWLVEIRRSIAAEARARFSLPQIGRALNRDHSTVISLLKGAAK